MGVEDLQDVRQRILDRAAGGVDTNRRILRLLVRRGYAGEMWDLAGGRLGVQPFAVAPLALLERGGEMDQREGATRVLDHRAYLLPGCVEGGNRAADSHSAVAADLCGDPADPADVGLSILAGEGEPGRQVPAYDVAVEARHRPLALLQDEVMQRPGQRRLAAARQAGEEQHQTLLIRRGTVPGDDLGDLGGKLALAGGSTYLTSGVGLDHPVTERPVCLRVSSRRQRWGPQGGVR